MNFKEALKKLDIEDYSKKIFSSSSTGELFHLEQYIVIAEDLKNEDGWFRDWFEGVIKFAEDKWGRPDSVYQHVLTILLQHMDNNGKSH